VAVAEKSRRATYADLEAVPPEKVAELIDGELHVFPRPAPRHMNAQGGVVAGLRDPFQFGDGGPGGWWIIPEPERHFPEPAEPGGIQVVSPDVAGWRCERMPDLPTTPYFKLAPDWVCEVLSPRTKVHDRTKKMPLYAQNGVAYAWLVDPIARVLEVHVLGPARRSSSRARRALRRWNEAIVHRGDVRVQAVPFDAIELDLGKLWAGAAPRRKPR